MKRVKIGKNCLRVLCFKLRIDDQKCLMGCLGLVKIAWFLLDKKRRLKRGIMRMNIWVWVWLVPTDVI